MAVRITGAGGGSSPSNFKGRLKLSLSLKVNTRF